MAKKKQTKFSYNIPQKPQFKKTQNWGHGSVVDTVINLRNAVQGAKESVPMINSTITNVCFDLVLGPHGLNYRPTIATRDYKGTDHDAERRIGRAIKKWKRDCTLAGKSWFDVEQKIVSELFLQGEVFVLLTGGKIQIITADHRDISKTNEKKNIFYGIQYDGNDRPIFYWFDGKKVPAEMVLHVYDNNYVYQDSGIGIPRFSHILKDIDKTDQLIDSAITQSIFAAGINGFLQDDEETEYESDEEDEIIQHTTINPQEILELPSGKKFVQAKIETQAGKAEKIIDAKNRAMAKSIGFSVRAIFGDLSGLNYPGLRTVTNDDFIAATRVQNLLIDKFYEPVYEYVITHIVKNKQFGITLPITDIDRFAEMTIIRPPKPAIDPTREAKAQDMDISSGRSTQTHQLAERGITFEEWAQTKKRELEILQKLGLDPVKPQSGDLIITDAE